MTEQEKRETLRQARANVALLNKARSGELVTMEGDLPTVIVSLAANLQHAVANMAPDDMLIELDAYQDGTKSSARLRFRAYRRAAS
jgi:hypothetical protein